MITPTEAQTLARLFGRAVACEEVDRWKDAGGTEVDTPRN